VLLSREAFSNTRRMEEAQSRSWKTDRDGETMRIFADGKSVMNETVREVFSRGSIYSDPTRQGKLVEGKEAETREILNYSFKLLDVSVNEAKSAVYEAYKIFKKPHLTYEIGQRWFESFFNTENPSTWWCGSDYLVEYWKQYGLEPDGTMAYEYGERIAPHIEGVIAKLKRNPNSRGAVLGIWNPEIDLDASNSGRRSPCTLEYIFFVRDNTLCMTFNMRAQDLVNFFALDLVKAMLLQMHVANALRMKTGYLIENVVSLHAYYKDVPEENKW
jgi:thymidylate synthase